MKVKIIEDSSLDEDVVIITRKISPKIEQFAKSLQSERQSIIAQFRGADITIAVDDILFFETESDCVVVHLEKDYYKTKYKLYTLEEALPNYFMRVSKSCIINLNKVMGYENSIGSSRTIFFSNSEKTSYVSRMYYKQFKDRLIERSL